MPCHFWMFPNHYQISKNFTVPLKPYPVDFVHGCHQIVFECLVSTGLVPVTKDKRSVCAWPLPFYSPPGANTPRNCEFPQENMSSDSFLVLVNFPGLKLCLAQRRYSLHSCGTNEWRQGAQVSAVRVQVLGFCCLIQQRPTEHCPS